MISDRLLSCLIYKISIPMWVPIAPWGSQLPDRNAALDDRFCMVGWGVHSLSRQRLRSRYGDRLLRFSQKAHDGMLQNVAQNLGSANDDVGGYDVQARRVHGTLVGSAPTTGSLIDGRM